MRSLEETVAMVKGWATSAWSWIKYNWIVLMCCVWVLGGFLALALASNKKPRPTYTPIVTHESVMVKGVTVEKGEGVYRTAPGSLVVPPNMWEVPNR